MKVRDVMKTEVVTVSPDMTYREAARVLAERHFSGVPVMDKQGKLVGMLSEKNLFRALYPRYQDYLADPGLFLDQEAQENRVEEIREKPISEFMYREVVTIPPDAPIMRAGAIMLARNFNRLPVVENGELVGIVSRRDVFSTILRHHLD